MASPRTLHDIRTLRSVATRLAPSNESAIWLRLHRLASEKLRLEREAELWQRKRQRIEQRLSEIEQQMQDLRGLSPGVAVECRASGAKRSLRHVTLEY